MSDRRIWGIGLFLVCLVTVLLRGTPAAGEEPGFRSSLIVAQGDQSPESAGEATTPPEKKKRQKQKKTSSGPSSATPFPVGKAPPRKKKKPPQVETLVTNTGILVPQGKLLVENTLEYIHNTATQVALQGFTVLPAILIGTINVESVEQDIYMDVLTFYYGITNNLEAEVDVPYVYRTEGVLSYPINGGSGTLLQTGTSGNGLGDIEFGLHEQLNHSGFGGAYFLANVIGKANNGTNPFTIPINSKTGLLTAQPTGSGFWSIEPSLTAIYPTDPVVFYANAAYIYNFSANFGGNIGLINPGNATDLSFGAGFSLNDKTSFDVGYDQMTLWPPTQNGVQIPLTQVLQLGSLVFGYSYNVSRYFFYLLNVEVGVTPDAPNIQISFRVPLYF
ncbi:hypothetical protein [Leptospirillum ferriphilum]|uniref:Transporter n=1 Tax=Leptospirillum ferriphilum YSK TaxID=1441628 RepID=A0A059Y340_9BACT|nr:hypothetical protein [Leptospirillum ferriphilum]AIA31927.1 hypothetical protein Y981_10460 [Leptospirillum ferriphilum YSK]